MCVFKISKLSGVQKKVATSCYIATPLLRVFVCLSDEFKQSYELKLTWKPHQNSSSLCRCPYSWSSPAMSDHPRARQDLYPTTAAPRVGHHAFLHHHGHHLPHSHLWTAGGIALAPRSHQIRPLDCLHWQ